MMRSARLSPGFSHGCRSAEIGTTFFADRFGVEPIPRIPIALALSKYQFDCGAVRGSFGLFFLPPPRGPQQCPRYPNSGQTLERLIMSASCPLYPRKRTCAVL